MSTIRLTRTKELDRMLKKLRKQFPLMDDPEIIRVCLGLYFVQMDVHSKDAWKQWDSSLPVVKMTEEEYAVVKQAKKDIKEGRCTVLESEDDISVFLDSL